MTTRQKVVLSGFLPDGSLYRFRTSAGYSYARFAVVDLITRDRPVVYQRVQFHHSAGAARHAASFGEAIVALTEAKLLEHDRHITIKEGGLTWTYPQCYACDKQGIKVSPEYRGRKRPACAGRHAAKEAS